jgi:hypothetical protein
MRGDGRGGRLGGGGEDHGLVQGAIGGDGDAETGSGECINKDSEWMVSIEFTPGEKMRK